MVIDGVTYFTSADVKARVGIGRVVLWRWRKARLVPEGRYDRRRHLLFTEEELQAIKDYANRIEPAGIGASRQPQAVNRNGPGKRGGT